MVQKRKPCGEDVDQGLNVAKLGNVQNSIFKKLKMIPEMSR